MSLNKNIKQKLIDLGYQPNKFKMQFVFKKWYSDLFKLNVNLTKKYIL